MTNLLVVILDDLSQLPDLLAAWKRIKVPGVTILHSFGGFLVESWLQRLGLGGISRLLSQVDARQRMLMSLIDDEDLLELAIAVADEVVGGFDRPNSGILFTIPVGKTLGLRKWDQVQQEADETSPKIDIAPERLSLSISTPVRNIMGILGLDPAIVRPEATLVEIVNELSKRTNVQVVCVVNQENHLIGLIDVNALANALFQTVFPEEYLGDLKDLEHVLEYVDRTKIRTAADIMQKPVWVQLDDDLHKAFHSIHQCGLAGIPVVDEKYRVVGYINLLELMMVCIGVFKESVDTSLASEDQEY